MPATTIPSRAEIPQAYYWNAESVFPDVQAWDAEFQAIFRAIDNQAITTLAHIESGTELHRQLEAAFAWLLRAETVFVYAILEHSV
ncbi:MAG: hypothetical protein E4G99_08635, partial [Anaerolineales bacterium]